MRDNSTPTEAVISNLKACFTLHLMSSREIDLFSTITCPKCGHREKEEMPTNACQFFYHCKGCGERLILTAMMYSYPVTKTGRSA